MSVRDEYGWAASPTIELVTAFRMNQIGAAFGQTRMLGMTTPGVDLKAETIYLPIDYLQTPTIRLCFVAKRLTNSPQDEIPQIRFNVYTRAEAGGPSLDTSTFYGPGGGGGDGSSGSAGIHPTYRYPVCDRLKDPWTWVQSGSEANGYSADGYAFPIYGANLDPSSHDETMYWVQLPLVRFTSARGFDGFKYQRFEGHPQHQKLLLEISFDDVVDPGVGGGADTNLQYIQDFMVWEWPLHPDSPSYVESYELFGIQDTVYRSIYSVEYGEHSGSGASGLDLNIFSGT